MHSHQHSRLTNLLLWLLCITGLSSAQAANSLATEAIINLPTADAWALFSSDAGLASLGYTRAAVELRPGGSLQASDGNTLPSLTGEVLSLDTGHMLSFKPAGSANQLQWTVLYFTAMGKDMTQLRWLDFFAPEQLPLANQRQQQVRRLFDQLIRRYAPECAVCKLEKAAAK